MIAMASHRWYVQPQLATYITFGVGYCFIHVKGNAKTRMWDKADIVPTPLSCTLTAFFWELGSAKTNEDEKTSTQFP